MKISIFVHELLPQVGHSRAMIELINGLTIEQKSNIEYIETISFESKDLNQLFPEINCPKKIIKIPGMTLKPFLLKMFTYHILSFFYSLFFCRKKIKIGIGIASLNVNISNIQFIHKQWEMLFFQKRRLNLIQKIYKKALFKYFEIGEHLLFKNKNIQFIVIAHFLQNFIKSTFGTGVEQIHLIPSGVNTTEFSIESLNQQQIIDNLVSKHVALKIINFDEPVILFVGAFERKGLDRVLDYLKDKPSSQLILIGKPESYSSWNFPTNIRIAHVLFTEEINLFYAISDIFIFPTYYEPFGLVILEAYSMGLDLIIPKDNVGASEILINESDNEDGIYFFLQQGILPEIHFKKVDLNQRKKRRRDRLNKLSQFSWEKSAEKFYSILSKY
jgi:glycosyltransferase involved in cell wall biosynthesis